MRYAGVMRYADGGGLTAERRAAREGIRLEAGQRFAQGDRTSDIAKDLRVSECSVEQWRRNWREGGMEGLKSKGPAKLVTFLVMVYALLAFRYGLSEATRLTRSIGGFFSANPPL
ncbi:helix-turn-helix domain-containing protein [Streptomyces sp. NPDC017991]|uniref:helix-turn-helix domain-containing protein n=1 Tax=Streptomyces sp. NPDC017991 TaxID=3365026 RepID=UPI0037B2A01A